MKIFYFTATGNSLHVARQFAGAELFSIPQVLRSGERTFRDERIGIVFPVYGLVAPRIVKEFVRIVKLESEYAFSIPTYGNIAGGAGGWFHRFAAKHGLRLDYVNTLLMADNYLPLFDMDKQRAKDKREDEHLARLVEDVAASRVMVRGGGIGGRLLTGALGLFANAMLNICRKFRVSDACTRCGTCAKVCPRSNVALKNGRPGFGDNCDSCLACVHICPANAITLPREKNPGARYRHPGISVADIMAANG